MIQESMKQKELTKPRETKKLLEFMKPESRMNSGDLKKLLRPTEVYNAARLRLQELQAIRSDKEASLRNAPPGKIHLVKSKNRVQYYLRMESQEKSGSYLRKKEISKCKTYLQKSYDEKVLKAINFEIANLNSFLEKSTNNPIQYEQIYESYPKECQAHLKPIQISDKDYLEQWLSIPYERKNVLDNTSVFKTDQGDFVRSKSELMIANTLFKHRIPYKYECPIVLHNNFVVHPDFTLLNVRTRRVIYWEHRGMMDDREYAKHTVQRIRDYKKSGIWLGEDLILTEETLTSPLGTSEIEEIIRHYLG